MNAQEIRRLLEKDELIIGHDAVRKSLKSGSCSQVIIAANAQAEMAAAIKDYCEMSSVDCVELDLRNDAIGTTCRKPFSISFLAVKA